MDPQQVAQVVNAMLTAQQAQQGVFDGQINIPTIITVLGAAFLLYGRIVKIETKLDPIWKWWNASRGHHLVDDEGEALLIERRHK